MTKQTYLEYLIQETSSLLGERESKAIAKSNCSYGSTLHPTKALKGIDKDDEWYVDKEASKCELDEERVIIIIKTPLKMGLRSLP